MAVVDELRRAREAYDRRDWLAAYDELSAADPTQMAPSDFAALGTVAYLVGRQNDCVQAMQRAYRAHLDADHPLGAASCAFWLARTLLLNGEPAVASGWAGRAQRLLDDEPHDVVERGYVRILDMLRQVVAGQFGDAVASAGDIEQYGRRFHDPDLMALGLAAQGRLLLYDGRVPDGLALLDEAMAGLAAGEVSPVFAGQIYCLMIEACQEVSDLGRAGQWTAALTAWCEDQSGLVAFTGQCAVHRGQIMRLHGAYDEALEELDRAVQRYLRAGTEVAAGLSFSERGDVLRLRGDLSAAEVAYDKSVELGHDPQPGLALLWLAQGRAGAASRAGRRLMAELRDPVHRSQLLPGLVEIFLATGAGDEAEAASAELTEVAAAFGCDALQAAAAYAAARCAIDRGEAASAVPALRQAVRIWNSLKAPYEGARCRAQLGRALRSLGDERSAEAELAAAAQTFAELGVVPARWELAGPGAPSIPGGLSPREVEVLRLVAAGHSNQQIAASLVLSEKTVARHLSNIFTKLDVPSRTAAAAFAFEHHLV